MLQHSKHRNSSRPQVSAHYPPSKQYQTQKHDFLQTHDCNDGHIKMINVIKIGFSFVTQITYLVIIEISCLEGSLIQQQYDFFLQCTHANSFSLSLWQHVAWLQLLMYSQLSCLNMWIYTKSLFCDGSGLEFDENSMGKGQAGRMHNYPSHRRGYLVNRKGFGRRKKKVVKKASGTTYFVWLIAKQEHSFKFIM